MDVCQEISQSTPMIVKREAKDTAYRYTGIAAFLVPARDFKETAFRANGEGIVIDIKRLVD